MNKILKITSYVLMAALFSVALSGCGKQQTVDPRANQVIVWSFEDPDVWKTTKKEFEKANKGYTLVYEQQTLDANYENRALNSILSGDGPDVWSMPSDWVYRHKDKLYPMPSKLASAIDLDKQYVPSVKQSVYFNDKIYALSPYSEPLMVYYNSKIFQNALTAYNASHNGKTDAANRQIASNFLNGVPNTWTNFAEAVKLLTQKDGSTIQTAGVAMGTDKVTNAQDILYLLMLQNETAVTSDDLKLATFNLPKDTPRNSTDIPGQRALEFYTSFSDPANANYAWSDALGNDIDAFANGKVAMIFGYSSLQNTLAQKYPNFRYKRASMPQLTEEASTFVDYARFNAFGVSTLAANPTVAWNVITTIQNITGNEYNSALKLYTSKKATNYDISAANRNTSSPEKLELATAKSLVKGRYPIDFDTNIKNAIYAVNNHVQDAKSALDLAANNITELLRKETW